MTGGDKKHPAAKSSRIYDGMAGFLLRGCGGMAILYAAYAFRESNPAIPILAVTLALMVLHGCPVCWLMQFVQAIWRMFKTRSH